MNINIIGTGSSGNAILFEGSILLDAGLPFKELQPHISGVNTVLLTHIHGDHFNSSSIRKMHIQDESIKFCCGDFLVEDLEKIGIPSNNIICIKPGCKYKSGDITFSPFNLQHDVPNFGYRVLSKGKKHFHATDTAHLQGISAKNYDSATIECNHERSAALKIIEEKKISGEFSHLKRTIDTHLSVDKAVDFISENKIKKFYPVHMGSSTRKEVELYILENLNE